ncbi:MAG TPA: hypothetical protein VGX03_02500, partial [Candidatus Binatia bacterium]|nr:hypothetical protein [Candidatus Binatia bacterium]
MTFVQQTSPLTSNRREIKESGLHWLGRIPVNWHVHAVKRHYDIQLGKMLQNGSQSQEDREVPYAKALHVQWGRVIVDELPT